MIDKHTAGLVIDEARQDRGLTWNRLAEIIERPPVWTVSALLGMHPVPQAIADVVRDELGLDEDIAKALTRQPVRIGPTDISADPTIYRFHELIAVYGAALKALIHEEFGDGIMSAINCSVAVDRGTHPDGDRVRVTIDGKFLPYAWNASEG
ncbi:cyanase [Gordonia desulfuricans]|uniref:Cyanate hydratase n=1 Tax=Gordonia desulfuricans TaxID=89051 RepID=A0A7K3LQA5_9ACTN|nr:cyanase [Gordonia desulfuricans]NDK90429.1 cyanase [Gordonia desulfuricans]